MPKQKVTLIATLPTRYKGEPVKRLGKIQVEEDEIGDLLGTNRFALEGSADAKQAAADAKQQAAAAKAAEKTE